MTVPYTEAELAIIAENSHLTSQELAALLPGRTWKGLHRFRWRNNMPRTTPRQHMPTPWTEDEIRILRENAHLQLAKIAKLLPNRTMRACRWQKSELGLTGRIIVRWTDAEIEMMQTHGHLSAKQLAELMPGRAWQAIDSYRRRHPAVPRPAPIRFGADAWTDEEVAIIREHPHLYSTQFGELLPGRSWKAIGKYRQEHDIPGPGIYRRAAAPKPPREPKPVRVRAPKPAPAPKPPKLRIVPRRVEPAPKPEPVVIERDLRVGERRCTAVIPQPGGLFRKCTNPTSKGPVCPACLSFFRRAG